MLGSGHPELPHEGALKSISEGAAKSADPAIVCASTKPPTRPTGPSGCIPIDKNVSDVIKPRTNGVAGNGQAGPDYVAALEKYNSAMRWRK
jgi:hypothetical protein